MKLLLCTLEYPPQIGGVASYYYHLISTWPKSDSWRVLDNSHSQLCAPAGSWPWRRAFIALWKELQAAPADLVFIGQILPLGTVALLLNIIKPFTFGLFLHGMDLSFALKSPRKRFLAKLVLQKAKIIVCANSRVREILLNFLPNLKDKVIVLHPGAMVGRADNEIKAELENRYNLAGKKIIFSLGRLVKRKGFDQVIKSLEKVSAKSWLYLLAGDGPERESLHTLIAQSSVADKVVLMGALSEVEKWSCLDLCDIFITTSRDLDGDFEGFGIVYLEANLMAKPVIAGNSGGVADAVINNLNGLLVNPEDTNEIADAITKLLQNPAEASRLGLAGRERAEKDFSWLGQATKLAGSLKEKISSI